jgi:hypothetical protein
MNIIGIDVGKNGAMVMIDEKGEVTEIYTMPLFGKDYYDWIEIANILSDEKDEHVFIENVHAIYGASAGSTFTFGGGFHGIIAVVSTLQKPYTLVQPKEWQKVAYQGIHEIRKPPIRITKGKNIGKMKKGPKDTKAMSLVAAKRLFPNVDLRASERCKKPHEGIVDALLIAEYGRRLLNGESK